MNTQGLGYRIRDANPESHETTSKYYSSPNDSAMSFAGVACRSNLVKLTDTDYQSVSESSNHAGLQAIFIDRWGKPLFKPL